MSILQRTTVYMLIILLALFALPNIYPEYPSLSLSSKNGNESLTLESFHEQLSQLKIKPRSVELNEQEILIQFNSAKDQSVAHSHFTSLGALSTTLLLHSTHPNWMKNIKLEPMNLGLDLRGGVQLTLNVESSKSYQGYIDSFVAEIRHFNRQLPVDVRKPLGNISINESVISIENTYGNDVNFKELLVGNNEWELSRSESDILFSLDSDTVERLERQAMQQTLSVMRQRVESLGITEANIQQHGRNFIRIELPGVQDPDAAKSLIGATTSIAFYDVVAPQKSGNNYFDSRGENVRLANHPIVTGEDIIDSSATIGEFGQPEVNIVLNRTGGNKMSQHSRSNIGQPMATLFSEYHANQQGELEQAHEVISVATIQSQFGSRFRVTGVGDLREAQELASVLRSGALTVPVSIIDEQIIGPTLGEQNIKNGLIAVVLGLALTFVAMATLYGKFGLVACGALSVNMVMIVGLLSIIPGVALTLPGIAGLVLTMGMAVDCNVLVFERIKELRKQGIPDAKAISRGYKESYSTIIDANLTSLITAIVLFVVGYGAVKGFAVTLGIGIVTSLFTGLIVSQLWMKKTSPRGRHNA
ncbi:protein translocase subunit SecD [Vibrio ulleungensis]|uniref:Protein translocase subunit SecD n=1 Tax=Vibrio ulleungensis TaxID=2807619 RepID=A0ABS2HGT0_9VIBR|nr:protein translocase subunit SecD [Vibrio ulleungensis]MBM7035279.1 protein translocase subunit SecD [Vibrio ulleungensis]